MRKKQLTFNYFQASARAEEKRGMMIVREGRDEKG
jgi:hypothetical protein